jgi:ABC-2 type transport system permease protein
VSASAQAGGSTLRRDLSLAAWQIVYEQRAFWRNRARAFFSFLMPLMFLFIFATIYHGQAIAGPHGAVSYDSFFVPGILAYGIIATTFVNMALSTSILREQGVLKRMAGTPLPAWAYVAGRIGSTLLITAAMTLAVLAIGRIAYGVQVRAATLPGVVAALVLGSAAFTALGVGVVRYIKNSEAAPAVINFAILPLTFISGVWFHGNPSTLLTDIAKIFPVRPLAHALQYAFNPLTTGSGIQTGDLVTLGIWLVVGVILMLGFLRQPATGNS